MTLPKEIEEALDAYARSVREYEESYRLNAGEAWRHAAVMEKRAALDAAILAYGEEARREVREAAGHRCVCGREGCEGTHVPDDVTSAHNYGYQVGYKAGRRDGREEIDRLHVLLSPSTVDVTAALDALAQDRGDGTKFSAQAEAFDAAGGVAEACGSKEIAETLRGMARMLRLRAFQAFSAPSAAEGNSKLAANSVEGDGARGNVHKENDR